MTWPAALLVLALLFLGACSSHSSQMGSVTGPSPQTANGPQGGSGDGGTDTSGGGGSHM